MSSKLKVKLTFASAVAFLPTFLGALWTKGTEVGPFLAFVAFSVLLLFCMLAFLPLLTFIEGVLRNQASAIQRSSNLEVVDLTMKFLELLLPSRIMKEDAGDAQEVINKLHDEGAASWMIYTKLASSVFWILIAALREVLTVTKRKPN